MHRRDIFLGPFFVPFVYKIHPAAETHPEHVFSDKDNQTPPPHPHLCNACRGDIRTSSLADTQHYHLPWTGFFGKLCALHAYASALNNASAADDILIVIDAFDTRVTGTMQTMAEIHAKYFGENDIVFYQWTFERA